MMPNLHTHVIVPDNESPVEKRHHNMYYYLINQHLINILLHLINQHLIKQHLQQPTCNQHFQDTTVLCAVTRVARVVHGVVSH